jgi:hypothetical protein
MKRTDFFPNPSVTIGLMTVVVVTTSALTASVLWSVATSDSPYLDHINAFIAALMALLAAHRLYLGVTPRLARSAWIAVFVLFLGVAILSFFDSATDHIESMLGVEDIDDLCLWFVLPCALLVALRSEQISVFPFKLVLGAFVAQTVSTGLDLFDDNLAPIGQITIGELVAFSKFVYLQLYFVGLTLFMASLYLRLRPSGAAQPTGLVAGFRRSVIQPVLERLPRRIWATHRARYVFWRMTNWRGGYGAFYSHVNAHKLGDGRRHRTLGTQTWSEGPAWTGLEFEKRGTEILPDLAVFGLKPDSVCVDYGCGSLRIGQHLIRNLAPGCYWGLDVTDTFFRPAARVLPSDLIAAKKPNLHVIDEDVIARLERQPPDFIFSYAVLKHVPPREIDAFFDRFMRLVGPRTIAVLYFADAPTKRIRPMSWFHPAERLVGMVLQRVGDAAVGVTRIGRSGDSQRRHPRSVLWIAGSAVDHPMPPRLLLSEETVAEQQD